MTNDSPTGEDVTCPAFLWTFLRSLSFTESDDPKDAATHARMLTVARERWPWLDSASDQMLLMADVESAFGAD